MFINNPRIPFRTAVAIVSLALFSSCNTDKDDDLDVPSSYEFARDGASTVDFSGQTERLDMLALLSTYMKTANTVGVASVDEQTLNAMFGNVGDPFVGQTFSKDLKSKCFSADTAIFKSWFAQLADACQSSQTAASGVAGVLVEGSTDPNSGYRVNANGIEPTQIIEKGLMGAVFFYQAMEVYLSADRMGTSGNTDLVQGRSYTEMEHYFDEAFGYFGAPIDFPNPVTLDDARFWAKYCNTRNGELYGGINDEVSTAFRTARAAIAAQDYEERDAAIQTIVEKWAIVSAASAVDYLNRSKASSGNAVYKRHHSMSEAIGFMMALKYHFNGGNSKFPPHYNYAQIEQALDIVGPNTNLYNLTDQQLENAIGHIKNAFPQNEIK